VLDFVLIVLERHLLGSLLEALNPDPQQMLGGPCFRPLRGPPPVTQQELAQPVASAKLIYKSGAGRYMMTSRPITSRYCREPPY
jgi:hypothetical protein